MSHININRRLFSDEVRRYREELAILRAKQSELELQLRSAEDQLDSIFERVEKGEEVYLCLDDGRTLHIQAVLSHPADSN